MTRVTTESRRRLVIEFEGPREPVSGRIYAAEGPGVRFSGWLGLAAVLGQLLGSRSEREDTIR